MCVGHWSSSNGDWGSYWFDMDVWFGSDFIMYVWLSSNFFMYIGFGSNFFMYVWLSSNFEVEVWFSSWVYLSGVIVWVDVSSWGSSVGYWGSGIGGGSNWGSGYGSWGSSKSVSVSSIGSSIWITISSIGVSWSNNVSLAGGRGGGDQSGDNSNKSLHFDDELLLYFQDRLLIPM